ncbi:hypothetical protein PPERSA_06757 [Pseudocohnilembus persalinus]|uniref:chitin synthase n=1 Tax=Pseudocohnilembus persalinus TaxID=266149 RepID=A0A0V0QS50_PSEPJ|nr:hypothetical protein PPERSA_06757 [Pseudocohnilembus persalinus]|eukprot:KRX05123.1 hypothetical protein PPERSA_06757 [Pseudocohnilembus persalinus]
MVLLYIFSSFLGIIMLFAFIMAIIFAVQLMFGGIENDNENAVIDPKIVQVGIAITFGLYIFPVFFNLDKATQLLTSLPHYLFFTPTYINTLIIYAFGRIDDLSWGTKGLEGQNDTSKLAFNWIKYEWVIKWVR